MNYRDAIKRATGAPDADLGAIEALMRDTVFHSTLDWQSKMEFEAGARTAQKILAELDATDRETADYYREKGL